MHRQVQVEVEVVVDEVEGIDTEFRIQFEDLILPCRADAAGRSILESSRVSWIQVRRK